MDLQTRNLAVFVICLTSLVFFVNAQVRPPTPETVKGGDNVTFSCRASDVSSFDLCSWQYTNENGDSDQLGFIKEPDVQKNIKDRFDITMDYNTGECKILIWFVQSSDATQYGCTITNKDGSQGGHSSYKLEVEDRPAKFEIISDQISYTGGETKHVETNAMGVVLDCKAGPSETPATLEWKIEPEPIGTQILDQNTEGPDGSKTVKRTASFSLGKETEVRATCTAKHHGYPGGQMSITITVKLALGPPTTVSPTTTENPGKIVIRRKKYGFFYINEIIEKIPEFDAEEMVSA